MLMVKMRGGLSVPKKNSGGRGMAAGDGSTAARHAQRHHQPRVAAAGSPTGGPWMGRPEEDVGRGRRKKKANPTAGKIY